MFMKNYATYDSQAPSLNFLLRIHFLLRFPEARSTFCKKDTVQMIDLMLENPCQPTPGFDLHRLAVTIQCFHLHLGMTFHFTHKAGNGKTALYTDQFLF